MTKFRQLKFDQMDATIELSGLENKLLPVRRRKSDDEERQTGQ
jgi:hypothetical protein